jgi:hypothetical protein
MTRIVVLLSIILTFCTTTAEARHRHTSHHHHHYKHRVQVAKTTNFTFGCSIFTPCSYQRSLSPRIAPHTIVVKHYREHRHYVQHVAHNRVAYNNGQVIGGRPAGCPYAYCGCSVSLRVFGKIIPALNLAANWLRFPSASPAPGMVAARSGHVFFIESVNSDGTVVAHDGNSGGHLTRIHTVSLRGYRVVNPHG